MGQGPFLLRETEVGLTLGEGDLGRLLPVGDADSDHLPLFEGEPAAWSRCHIWHPFVSLMGTGRFLHPTAGSLFGDYRLFDYFWRRALYLRFNKYGSTLFRNRQGR